MKLPLEEPPVSQPEASQVISESGISDGLREANSPVEHAPDDPLDGPDVGQPDPAGDLPPEAPLVLPPYRASPELTRQLFERAIETHSRRLLAIARAIVGTRASPEDIVQQAVMNLYQHRDRYDWREPGGLLKRSVVNESLRVLRAPRMSVVAEEHPDGLETPVEGMIENETIGQVRAAIAKLPDHFRAALVLCEYENLSYAEIAQTLGASVPQVKTWLHRARRQLAKMLEPYVAGRRQQDAGERRANRS
jgi:RNA polymerase sigma-70 factor (ECF subfamily)